jgi:hypothetical protein
MPKKMYLKDPYADMPPVPFVALDYLLCGIVFFLIGIASNAQIAGLVASIRR